MHPTVCISPIIAQETLEKPCGMGDMEFMTPASDTYMFSQEDGRDVGIEDVFGELERASLLNAIVGSPLSRHRSIEPSDEKWVEDMIEEVFNAGGRYVPMESGKGQFMRRTHQQSPSVADFARAIGMEWPDKEDKGDFVP